MKKLLKRFLERLVAWMQRKVYEDTISEKESKRILREIEKMVEENKVK
jgi:CRISPR/Cas system-associated endoribonuclease Cas2